jgi:hypothetical protein
MRLAILTTTLARDEQIDAVDEIDELEGDEERSLIAEICERVVAGELAIVFVGASLQLEEETHRAAA